MNRLSGVSLFSCAGVGGLGLRDVGDMVVANELDDARADLFEVNYPSARMIRGDIWDVWGDVVAVVEGLGFEAGDLDVLVATPPCQGMSPNGMGKLLAEVRAGKREQARFQKNWMSARRNAWLQGKQCDCGAIDKLVLSCPENVPELADRPHTIWSLKETRRNYYLQWANVKCDSCHKHNMRITNSMRNCGVNNHAALLDWEQVTEIRHMHDTGNFTYQILADMFDVSKTCIAQIIRWETYIDAPDEAFAA